MLHLCLRYSSQLTAIVVSGSYCQKLTEDGPLGEGGGTDTSVIVASPDAPRTTSAPASVRGIDRQESSETQLRLDTSQSIQRRKRPGCLQPLHQAKNRLPRSPGAHHDPSSTNPRGGIAPRRHPAQQPCETRLPLVHHPGAHLDPCSTNSRGCLARQSRPAQQPCDTKMPPQRNPGSRHDRCRIYPRGRLAPRHRPAQPPCETKTPLACHPGVCLGLLCKLAPSHIAPQRRH